jgi:hypothetical protein
VRPSGARQERIPEFGWPVVGRHAGVDLSSTVVWGVSGPPKAAAIHGVGNLDGVNNAGTNGNFSVNPPSVNMAASLSNTVIPIAGLVAVT